MAVSGCPCMATRPRAAEPRTTTDIRRHLAPVRGGRINPNANDAAAGARSEAHRTWIPARAASGDTVIGMMGRGQDASTVTRRGALLAVWLMFAPDRRKIRAPGRGWLWIRTVGAPRDGDPRDGKLDQSTRESATFAGTQSRQNSLPSTSCITRHDSL